MLELIVKDRIARIRLNRPDKGNTLNARFWQDLPGLVAQAQTRTDVRVIVLEGEGAHFCGGIDWEVLEDIFAPADQQTEDARHRLNFRHKVHRYQSGIEALADGRVPVIAAIQGACIGAGFDVALAADILLCSADARFAVKEVDVGIVADLGVLQRLQRAVPRSLARELALTGRVMEAQEAHACGLVSHLCADVASLRTRVDEIATKIAAASPVVTAGIKEIQNYAEDHPMADAMSHVALWQTAMGLGSDRTSAVQALRSGAQADFDDLGKRKDS